MIFPFEMATIPPNIFGFAIEDLVIPPRSNNDTYSLNYLRIYERFVNDGENPDWSVLDDAVQAQHAEAVRMLARGLDLEGNQWKPSTIVIHQFMNRSSYRIIVRNTIAHVLWFNHLHEDNWIGPNDVFTLSVTNDLPVARQIRAYLVSGA